MSQDTSSTHFTTMDVCLLADNLPNLNNSGSNSTFNNGESINISIRHKEKSGNAEKPFYSSCDNDFLNFFDINTNLSLKQKLNKDGYIKQVSNTFVMLHFTSEDNDISSPVINRINGQGNSVLVSKTDIISNCTWELESMVRQLHQSCQEKERRELFDEMIYDFPTDSMFLKSFYLFTDESCDSINLPIQRNKRNRLNNIWNILTSKFDITKAQYNVIVLSESIDSLNFMLSFNDLVKIHPISLAEKSGISYEKGPNYIKFNNIKSNHSLNHGVYRLFTLSKDDNQKYSAEGIYNNARYNQISLFVDNVGAERIQWIRLFVISSFLAYFVSVLFVYLNKLFKIIRHNK